MFVHRRHPHKNISHYNITQTTVFPYVCVYWHILRKYTVDGIFLGCDEETELLAGTIVAKRESTKPKIYIILRIVSITILLIL